ncbi:hypothetical protein GS504_03375 [Rhodococcus hoagii]|nr:hypothetical protein [Prescottella equi]NKS56597.1 hypothetical protein [Prescottella equi]
MTDINDIPRQPRRELTDNDIEREIAGIRVGLELGGLTMTDLAEESARAVLTGTKTADAAIADGLAELRRRTNP